MRMYQGREKRRRQANRQRGIALVSVLVVMIVLSGLSLSMLSTTFSVSREGPAGRGRGDRPRGGRGGLGGGPRRVPTDRESRDRQSGRARDRRRRPLLGPIPASPGRLVPAELHRALGNGASRARCHDHGWLLPREEVPVRDLLGERPRRGQLRDDRLVGPDNRVELRGPGRNGDELARDDRKRREYHHELREPALRRRDAGLGVHRLGPHARLRGHHRAGVHDRARPDRGADYFHL